MPLDIVPPLALVSADVAEEVPASEASVSESRWEGNKASRAIRVERGEGE